MIKKIKTVITTEKEMKRLLGRRDRGSTKKYHPGIRTGGGVLKTDRNQGRSEERIFLVIVQEGTRGGKKRIE